MLEADSCHRLRPAEERRGGKGAEGHTARQDRRPGTLGGHGRVSRTAGGRRPPPLPPPRVGLCNPVAAARPRAGPWGEGRGRLGWGREAATRGAACTVDPRADGRVSRSRVRREARAGGRPGGETASKSLRGKEARAEATGLRGARGSFSVEAVPETGWGTQREPSSRVTSFSATGISSPARFAHDSASEALT